MSPLHLGQTIENAHRKTKEDEDAQLKKEFADRHAALSAFVERHDLRSHPTGIAFSGVAVNLAEIGGWWSLHLTVSVCACIHASMPTHVSLCVQMRARGSAFGGGGVFVRVRQLHVCKGALMLCMKQVV